MLFRSEISGAHARIEDAVAHALAMAETYAGEQFDYVVALQAAVPIRPPCAIDALVNQVEKCNARGGITVVPRSSWIWSAEEGHADTWWNPRKGYPRSQDVSHRTFEEVNSIQVTPRAEALAGRRWGSPLLLLELPRWADADIDVPEDLEEAEATYASLKDRDTTPIFPWNLVAHPDVPKISSPLDYGMGRNRIGVVFGNGPSIDELPDELFRKLEGPQYLSIGVKRAVCSKRLTEAEYAPDLSLQWDAPAKGQQLTESMRDGLRKLEGRTWRLCSPEHAMTYYPCDQVLMADCKPGGNPGQAFMVSVVPDAACNVLYRLGVRELYLYGVELNDARHCAILPDPEVYREPHDLSHEDMRTKFVGDWRNFRDVHPDLKVWCACKESRLVREGVFEYREILSKEEACANSSHA